MATTTATAAPSEYHLRLAGKDAGARAILLCERYPRPVMLWHTAVELAYALALAEDSSLAPDLGALRAALAPRTAAVLAAADAMYRPLDRAAYAITELPPAQVHERMDAYLAQAKTPSGVPLPSAVDTIVRGRRPDPLSDYRDPQEHGLAAAKVVLVHQLGIPTGHHDHLQLG